MKIFLLGLSIFLWMLPVMAQEGKTLVKVGETVPDFKVEMFDGKTVDIKELRGKVVLLNFWATWCPPCRQELARVQKDFIDRFKGKDFVFLPVSRQDSYEKIQAFRQQMGYTFSMGMDRDRTIYSKFATAGIPRNFLIGKDGKILLAESGYSEELFQQLVQAIEKALQ